MLIYSGMVFTAWLPGGGAYHPKTIHSYRDYFLHIVTPHPVFEGIEMDDLISWRGTAGFFLCWRIRSTANTLKSASTSVTCPRRRSTSWTG